VVVKAFSRPPRLPYVEACPSRLYKALNGYVCAILGAMLGLFWAYFGDIFKAFEGLWKAQALVMSASSRAWW